MSVWYPGLPFGSLFRDLFRTSSFGCILVDPWLTFGTLWTPIGSLLAPFASLLAPFDSLLAPLVSLLAPFGSLLAPFRHPPGSFSHFWQHFGFALAFFTFFGSKSGGGTAALPRTRLFAWILYTATLRHAQASWLKGG